MNHIKTNPITYKTINIAYTQTGNGQPLILLHGFLENKTMWQNYLKSFSDKYHVITIDLLGHGKTGCLGYIHTMTDMALMVHHLITQLNLSKPLIVGHSMGGYVALELASKHPSLIKGLVLLNSTAQPDSPERIQNRNRAIQAVKQNANTFINLAIANLFNLENRHLFTQEIEQAKNQALLTPLQGIIAALEGMKIRNDHQNLLKKNTFPILLVLGKKDPVLDYETTLAQTLHTPTQVLTFPDGHMSHIENKNNLIQALKHFFDHCTNPTIQKNNIPFALKL